MSTLRLGTNNASGFVGRNTFFPNSAASFATVAYVFISSGTYAITSGPVSGNLVLPTFSSPNTATMYGSLLDPNSVPNSTPAMLTVFIIVLVRNDLKIRIHRIPVPHEGQFVFG